MLFAAWDSAKTDEYTSRPHPHEYQSPSTHISISWNSVMMSLDLRIVFFHTQENKAFPDGLCSELVLSYGCSGRNAQSLWDCLYTDTALNPNSSFYSHVAATTRADFFAIYSLFAFLPDCDQDSSSILRFLPVYCKTADIRNSVVS